MAMTEQGIENILGYIQQKLLSVPEFTIKERAMTTWCQTSQDFKDKRCRFTPQDKNWMQDLALSLWLNHILGSIKRNLALSNHQPHTGNKGKKAAINIVLNLPFVINNLSTTDTPLTWRAQGATEQDIAYLAECYSRTNDTSVSVLPNAMTIIVAPRHATILQLILSLIHI